MHLYKVTRKGLAVKCGKRYQWGRNARTCKSPENPKRRIYSKKAKKRAVDTDATPNRRQKLNVRRKDSNGVQGNAREKQTKKSKGKEKAKKKSLACVSQVDN
ncbi:hypothetical protein FCV25MIE_17112 [Fagus crenata]